MSQHDATAAGEKPKASIQSDADQLAALKRLLLSEEREELQVLRAQIEASGLTSDELAGMLPKAVWQAASRDSGLSDAMGPMLGEAMKSAIKNDADAIAEAISPIMGPAIRATIQQSIRSMVQSLNKTLEYSVSAKGLKWRWEAFQTGKSFAEVVLLHTLLFRVIQVFLIDRETGLLIKHAAADETADNVDLASGMLTAIQDFVRDSFGATEDDSLSTMSFGNQTVWIETGAHAFLALVIEGEAPNTLRTTMQETLEQIHRRFGGELDAYQGDSAPFTTAQPLLESCLVTAYEEDEKKKVKTKPPKKQVERPAWQKALLWAGIAGLVLGAYFLKQHWNHQNRLEQIRRQLAAPSVNKTGPSIALEIKGDELICSGSAHDDWIRDTQTLATRLPGIKSVNFNKVTNLDEAWLAYLTRLRGESGLVVTEAQANEGQYTLTGLRDPLAADPNSLLRAAGLNSKTVTARWLPFQSLDPAIVKARTAIARKERIKSVFPPGGGNIEFELIKPETKNNRSTDWLLEFRGSAPAEWINGLKPRAEAIAGDDIKLSFEKVVISSDPQPGKTPVPAKTRSLHLRSALQHLAHDSLVFAPGQDQLTHTEKAKLPTIAQNLHRVLAAADLAGQSVTITLIGTAEKGDGAAATVLSKRRAETVWKSLQSFDFPASKVLIQGIGASALKNSPQSKTPELAHRCCLIRITVAPRDQNP